MTTHLQTSLLDVAEPGGPSLGPLDDVKRTRLSHGAWIDVLPGWVSGSDDLFLQLVETVPWYAERRTMYDRVVDVPRLLSWYGEDAELPTRCSSGPGAPSTITTAQSWVNGSVRLACATTATGVTAWRGTETPSDAADMRTRWWRSCRLERLAD